MFIPDSQHCWRTTEFHLISMERGRSYVKKVKYLRRKNVCWQENYGEGTLLGEKGEIFKEKERLLSGELRRGDDCR